MRGEDPEIDRRWDEARGDPTASTSAWNPNPGIILGQEEITREMDRRRDQDGYGWSWYDVNSTVNAPMVERPVGGRDQIGRSDPQQDHVFVEVDASIPVKPADEPEDLQPLDVEGEDPRETEEEAEERRRLTVWNPQGAGEGWYQEWNSRWADGYTPWRPSWRARYGRDGWFLRSNENELEYGQDPGRGSASSSERMAKVLELDVENEEEIVSGDKNQGEGNEGIDDQDLPEEIEMDHLYFVKPLASKNGKAILQAVQELYLQLRGENLPVRRILSDRAREFMNPALKEWALDRDILLTRTEGQSPQSNGSAERCVRYLKGQARLLLKTDNVGVEHWPSAMATAAHRQKELRLRPVFGTKVAIKKKIYGQGGSYDLQPRWVKGAYMGPVWDVVNGSAVMQEDNGRFTVTTHFRLRMSLASRYQIQKSQSIDCAEKRQWEHFPVVQSLRELAMRREGVSRIGQEKTW